MKKLEDYITSIPDFPIEGVIFRDITTVLENAEGFQLAVDAMIEQVKTLDFDVIVAPEARGFIFGAPIAYALNKPFVLVRKKGKLPRETVEINYQLEYGSECLQIHKEAIKKHQKILIVDDLLATGGTLKAICELVNNQGGDVVSILSLIELEGLEGRKNLKGYTVNSVLRYEGN